MSWNRLANGADAAWMAGQAMVKPGHDGWDAARRSLRHEAVQLADGARRPQAGFFTHRAHQPVGAMSPSTTLHALGATNWAQPSHWWPSFGVA
jgi:hypothetical protein